ncbi:hypothetical protein GCM10010967_42040 [Dyadobacter beijingensis]|uniref:Thiamine-phosphate synthase n=1 Tax=Dyadobacter beijingensis TaxID=365489 RepID=A0ABQ2I7M2_9BACT|nr:thiamine phosphate synthase [Dyadobacter beijingensis]GGN02979.1 hypothetical protein GCM10010967_42040 [Dyadobacter beijingensis]
MENLIVITHPEMLPGEADIINELFAQGLARLHIRKPAATLAALRAWLEGIDLRFRHRIALHQHHELAGAFGIAGLHFTEQSRLATSREALNDLKNSGYTVSTSLHDPVDLATLSHCFDYAFLGPVFDSISKESYVSKLPVHFKLDKQGFPNEVIALGGINAENFKSVFEMGFDGAAVLGSIWQNPEKALEQCQLILSLNSPGLKLSSFQSSSVQQSSGIPGLKPGDGDMDDDLNFKNLKSKAIDRLHFISRENEGMSHIDSIRIALEVGCRWIQLRVKNRAEQEVLPIAWAATNLCDSYGAKLIINDFPRVALAVGAYGLHLGLTDMPVPEARALVGEQMVIGGTANTWADIALRVAEGADYIGLGPFRFTNTKQNLSPILGIEGYRALMRQMAAQGLEIPIIAIGGITPADIPGIRSAGIYGVAVSAALAGSPDPQETFYQIQNALC